MADPIQLAGDVVTGSTALAGLMLVYLGSVAISFAGYDTVSQNAVRGGYRVRAWFGFLGMVVAIASAALALLGKWEACGTFETAAIILLLAALAWALALALLTVLEVR